MVSIPRSDFGNCIPKTNFKIPVQSSSAISDTLTFAMFCVFLKSWCYACTMLTKKIGIKKKMEYCGFHKTWKQRPKPHKEHYKEQSMCLCKLSRNIRVP